MNKKKQLLVLILIKDTKCILVKINKVRIYSNINITYNKHP